VANPLGLLIGDDAGTNVVTVPYTVDGTAPPVFVGTIGVIAVFRVNTYDVGL
jgi:hypothetical protein